MQKTTTRTTSAPTMSERRSSRSSSGPRNRPTKIVGRNSTTKTAPTQRPESVRSLTSIASAIAARNVPMLEPRIDRKSRRKPARRSGASCFAESPRGTLPEANRVTGSRGEAREDVAERLREDLVLVRGTDRDAYRLGSPEGPERPDDDALPEELVEHGATVTDVRVEEVPERRPRRLEGVLAQRRLA